MMDGSSVVSKGAPRFSGVPTLMRAPFVEGPSELDIALIGVPFDGGCENRPGTRHGPREIRNMSTFMRNIHHVTRVNPFQLCRIADVGDVPIPHMFDLETAHVDIHKFFRSVVESGAVPLSVGGDHSISLPILRAVGASKPVGLVHFDAHTDTCDEELGHRFTHGTPFRRAVEDGLLDPTRTLQIGIRGAADSVEGWDYSAESGMRVIFMEEFTAMGVDAVITEVRRVVGDTPTYVSFDIDCLDPAFAPGTGTPEVGGMTTVEAQALLRGLNGLNLVGADVVEVSPPFDPSGNTALVGATMLYEMLCVVAEAVNGRNSAE
jgi:guanidinopropionase